MVKARKYVVVKRFEGKPKKSDYKIVESELPPLKNGEIIVKTEFISVDPYQQAHQFMYQVPYDQWSYQVGVVQESKDPKYPVGSRVVSHEGWCDYYVKNPSAPKTDLKDITYKLPDLRGLSYSHAVGAVGMPGASAYFGFLEICKPKEGETVVVSGAAGAVGSIAGQIAKIKGCKVIGFAGSDDKVKWLETVLGFDKAINYKKADIAKALKEAAPNGIDCYFDNVGGELSSQVILQMNSFGRVSVSGSMSSYNDDYSNLPKVTVVQPFIVFKQLKVEGFIYYRWLDRWDEALTQLAKWVSSGQIKANEHVTEGFDKIFEAFSGMLAGENFGKAVVKV